MPNDSQVIQQQKLMKKYEIYAQMRQLKQIKKQPHYWKTYFTKTGSESEFETSTKKSNC